MAYRVKAYTLREESTESGTRYFISFKDGQGKSHEMCIRDRFNKEFSRTEFDRKVRENPMNEHLIVKEEPAEERNEKEPEPLVPAWEQKKKVKGFDLHPDVPMADRHTFNLRENEVETVGKKERFRRNIMAIQLLKKCQEENRFATPEEQIILSKYVGWGGLSEAFDENNSAWATEYLELSSVLTPEEYASARESTLTAFYTPPEVITAIYKAMEQMGFQEGNLLEPSCGIGNFIGMLPDLSLIHISTTRLRSGTMKI